MKNKNSIYKNLQGVSIGIMTACLALTACDKDKEFTPAMPEAKLINSITFDVSQTLPLAIDMDSTIVCKVEAPEELKDRSILWRSTNDAVARVSQDGTITGVAEGTAVISATPSIGFGVEATVTVTVIPQIIKAKSVTLKHPKEGEVIYETDRLKFEAQILPADHTYSYLTWGSSDESVATVSEGGLVTCLKAGTTKITAYTHDHSNLFGSYELTVVEYIPVENVEISPYTDPVCISMGKINLDVTYTPADATLGSVTWTSSNENVATVDLGVVTPVGFGMTEITATCMETGVTASAVITVVGGWWIWSPENNFCGPQTQNSWNLSILNSQMGDGYCRIYFPATDSGKKWRQDIKIQCSNNAMFRAHRDYPVFVVKSTIPKGGDNTWDVRDSGNPHSKDDLNSYALSDGTRLIYMDLTEKFASSTFVDAEGFHDFNLFQIKVADIPYANVDPNKAWYDVYWIRTFKTVEEAISFAEAEIGTSK